MTIKRLHAGPRMSMIVTHGGTAYLAGQVAKDTDKDTADQTRQVLDSIDNLLAEAGSDKSSILSATIYLADITEFQVMNGVWEAWVVAGSTPARTTVQASLATPKHKVEITVIAALK